MKKRIASVALMFLCITLISSCQKENYHISYEKDGNSYKVPDGASYWPADTFYKVTVTSKFYSGFVYAPFPKGKPFPPIVKDMWTGERCDLVFMDERNLVLFRMSFRYKDGQFWWLL